MACAGTARGSADQSAARPSAKPKERKRDKYRHEPNRLFPSGVHLTAPTTTLKYFRATTSKYLRAQLHPAKAALPIGAEPTNIGTARLIRALAREFGFSHDEVHLIFRLNRRGSACVGLKSSTQRLTCGRSLGRAEAVVRGVIRCELTVRPQTDAESDHDEAGKTFLLD